MMPVIVKKLLIACVAVTAMSTVPMYYGIQYHRMHAKLKGQEGKTVTIENEEDLLYEIGYIYDVEDVNDYEYAEKTIYYLVKIPATNKIYVCTWDYGYSGFSRDDPVALARHLDTTDDSGWNGYIIGLHDSLKGKKATVWIVDNDDVIDE